MQRAPQFRLSTLLLVTLAAALATGWFVDSTRFRTDIDRLHAENAALIAEQSNTARRLDLLSRAVGLRELELKREVAAHAQDILSRPAISTGAPTEAYPSISVERSMPIKVRRVKKLNSFPVHFDDPERPIKRARDLLRSRGLSDEQIDGLLRRP